MERTPNMQTPGEVVEQFIVQGQRVYKLDNGQVILAGKYDEQRSAAQLARPLAARPMPAMSETGIIEGLRSQMEQLMAAEAGADELQKKHKVQIEQIAIDREAMRRQRDEIEDKIEEQAAIKARRNNDSSYQAWLLSQQSYGTDIPHLAEPLNPYSPEAVIALAHTRTIEQSHEKGVVVPSVDGKEKKPSFWTRKKALGMTALTLAAAAGIGAVTTGGIINHPATHSEENSADVNVAASAVLPLSSVKSKLAESFDACLDDQGRGTTILQAKQTSVTPISWPYMAADKSKVSLSGILGGQPIKPSVKLAPAAAGDKSQPNWNVGFTACVSKDNLADVVTVDDQTHMVNIDLKKISPQLQEGASSSLIGFLKSDADTTAIKGEDVIARLQSDKLVDQVEAARLSKDYSDKGNVTAENAQAARLASEALVKSDDIYAKQINAILGAKVLNLVKAQTDQLRKQGAIAKDDVTVALKNELNPITIVGPVPAKSSVFTISDPTKILDFQVVDGSGN